MDIEDAVVAVQAGDHEAYAIVVEGTQRRLRAFLAFRAPDRELIDEVAHAAYVTAFQKLAAYQPGTSFLAWLKAIALNHLRSERRRRSGGVPLEDIGAALAAEEAPRDDDLADRVGDLQRCLDRLGEDARRLLGLRYQDALSPAEIAGRLGRAASGVRTSLTRVRQALLPCMERHA
ncbi:MAG TPA: sigma-70 family RNA polymerase sigma factor [Planctomycetota bacterium]|nr:sigma-70 family RNA polymerase sigma factor [Planctomycetota bacterium]